MREWIAEQFLHLGWACFGQESECKWNYFNWLARLIGKGQWDDEGEPANLWTAIKFKIGHSLVLVHGSMLKE